MRLSYRRPPVRRSLRPKTDVYKRQVSICGTEQAMMDQAKKYIEIIASDFTEGQILTGKVVSIKDVGAFLEFAPGKEGLVHISKPVSYTHLEGYKRQVWYSAM